MASLRTFAALIDQDSVMVLEYRQEQAGFRVVDTRNEVRRFPTPESAGDVVIEMLKSMNAKRASLSIVLQHFGSFFHTMVLPPADDEVIRPIIIREIQRSFNIIDPAISFAQGVTVERRDPSRAGGQVPRQILIAGAPKGVIEALYTTFSKTRIRVEGLTVIPEVFRRLYDALDGSTEATALLVCLANGPHVAFFVNGRLELAIDPPLALEGEAPLDSAVIVDQLERGAIFLRQQARGMVATRLVLSSPASDYESLASTIEARTGMHVAPLGREIGSPETLVAMGAVLAARATERVDLYPRAVTFDEHVRSAMSGPAAITTTLMTIAAVAVFWCAMQLLVLQRTRADIDKLRQHVERSMPAVSGMRASAQGRERIAGIRASLNASQQERRSAAELLRTLAVSSPGARLDSITVLRVDGGWQTKVFGRASGSSGPAAMSAASNLYRQFQRQGPKVKDLSFESRYLPRSAPTVPASRGPAADDLVFTISFIAPAGQL